MAQWKKIVIAAVCAATVLLTMRFAFSQLPDRKPPAPPADAWKHGVLTAEFAGLQVHEIDASHSTLIFFFDLENSSYSDFRLTNGPNVSVMSRLQHNSSLSALSHPRLQESAFIPARNRTRIAIVIDRSFVWPAAGDPSADAKIRQLVSQEVADLQGFTLFDQASRYQIDLPGGWQSLQQVKSPAKSP